ncbi:MAG: hypothetical protein K8R23_16390 [Chthoniobacter sp.]|nr:hypothetical protein [Chthoniobacter sp.]
MKSSLFLAISTAILLALGSTLHSQAPTAVKSPQQILQAMKVKNQELLEKQAVTLQKLDELEKDAEQLKIFGKRS